VLVSIETLEPNREIDRSFDLTGVVTFCVLTLALTWVAIIPIAASGETVGQGEGWWPTHMPALLVPMLVALVVTAWRRGRHGLMDLFRRMIHWRVGVRWWLAAFGLPLGFIGAGLIAFRIAEGGWPAVADFGKMTGLPAMGVLSTWALITLINGFGEETGWRGFLLPELQRRLTPLKATLVLIPVWALWHVPYFLVLTRYIDLGVGDLVGFILGLASGAVILTWLANRSGGSVLLPTVWHGTFNVAAATAAAVGIIGAVASTLVMVQAGVLLFVEWRARRLGLPSIFRLTPEATPLSVGHAIHS
jgi:membrane protease YdiL (CAAX protease family)